MTQILDKDTLYDLLDRLNLLESQQLGVERVRPIQTTTKLKDTLTQEFENYRPPILTKAAFADVAMIQCRRKMEIAQRTQNQQRGAGNFTESAEKDFWKSRKEWILVQNGATYGYDFAREMFDTENPLAFDGEVKLSEFQEQIEYFSDSELLSLPGTLRNLLAEAQRRGFDLRCLGLLLQAFIHKYYPEQRTASFHYMKTHNTAGLFGLLTELINPEAELLKVRTARSKLVRHPQTPISTIIEKVKSLNSQELGIINPGMDAVAIEIKSGQLAQQSIRDFVSKETWSAYEEWVGSNLVQNKTTDLRDGLRKLDSLEVENASWRPTTSLAIRTGTRGIDPQALGVANIREGFQRDGSRGPDRARSGSFPRGRETGRGPGGSRRDNDRSWRDRRFPRQPSRGFRDNNRSPGWRRQRDSRTYRRDDRSSGGGRDRGSSSRDRWRSPARGRSFSGSRSPGNRDGRRGFGTRGGRDDYRARQPRRFDSRDRRPRSFSRTNNIGTRSGSRDRRRPDSRENGARSRYSGERRPEGRTRSWSLGLRPGRQRSGSGPGRRSTPSSARQSRLPASDRCWRCMQSGHQARECRRYPNEVKDPCYHCEKRGIRLFHPAGECRFRQSSSYRSPSRGRPQLNMITAQEAEHLNAVQE